MDMDPIGFLNLNKPAGLTSHDCVALVRKVFQTRRVGHGGTLDPDATGVLVLALGKATRFLSFLPSDKRYRATFQLGKSSRTDDSSGELLHSIPCPHVTLSDIESLVPQFIGSIQQIPPLYSAVHQKGKRMYDLARSGLSLEESGLTARCVTIHSLTILDWRPGDFPELDLEVFCGSGTYIRSIARDLGQRLGCGGLMSRLIRQESGSFLLKDSIPLSALQEEACSPEQGLQPIASAFQHLPRISLDPADSLRWLQGQSLACLESDSPLVQVWHKEKEIFLGLGSIQTEILRPIRVLHPNGSGS
jgi:tRNA pseudouridine55 synthase